MRNLFKPKTGFRQIRQIRPWQIGPLADFATNWAPHFLGPNLPFWANLALANWVPADWAPANLVSANCAPKPKTIAYCTIV